MDTVALRNNVDLHQRATYLKIPGSVTFVLILVCTDAHEQSWNKTNGFSQFPTTHPIWPYLVNFRFAYSMLGKGSVF